MTVQTTKPMPEEQMVHLVRNALLVAGHEMGKDGDHWPVVKSTIHSLMKDWEDLKVERNVHAELKKHVYAQLDEMDRIVQTRTTEEQADAAPKMKQLREIYDAYFQPVDRESLALSEEDNPIHLKRLENIISNLGGEDA